MICFLLDIGGDVWHQPKWMLLTLSKPQPGSCCKFEVIVGMDYIPPNQIFVFICFRHALQYILLPLAM